MTVSSYVPAVSQEEEKDAADAQCWRVRCSCMCPMWVPHVIATPSTWRRSIRKGSIRGYFREFDTTEGYWAKAT